MADQILRLSDKVEVARRFRRSVHLERDDRPENAADYFLTESTRRLLEEVSAALALPSQRAMTLTGPYGAGKSAFCAYLAKQLAPQLIPILIVGSRAPLAASLVAGLLRSLERGGQSRLLSLLKKEQGKVLANPNPTARETAELFQAAACLADAAGASGLLVVVDEAGKFLEYAAQHPQRGDLFAWQELAEAAARSGDAPLLLLNVMHQNVEDYAHRLGKTYQAEWAKVSGRFRPLDLHPGAGESLELLRRAITRRSDFTLGAGFERLISLCVQSEAVPEILRSRFAETGDGAFPLHPITALILPGLFRKMGQGQRSLFSFLGGEEPYGFTRFLRETPLPPNEFPLYAPDRLFDYAAETMASGWSAAASRQWAEALETTERAERISDSARRLLKCVALLGILRDPRLRANRVTLELCMTDAETDSAELDLQADLLELTSRQLIIYSRARDLFRLHEGGDVDIEAALEKAKLGLPPGIARNVAETLCPPPRLIANRHSYLTGALRVIQTVPTEAPRLAEAAAGASDRLTLLLCLAQTREEQETAEEIARDCAAPNLLFAISEETEALREAAAIALAADRVEKETPELKGDRAARRELEARRDEAETLFQSEWKRIFGAEDDGAKWFWQGQETRFASSREFSAFLSAIADASYPLAPNLRNELINRRLLSGAAAAGRRNLIENMLTKTEESRLGIANYPPELSMYECVLRATGIHRQNEAGAWEFAAPPENNAAKMRPVWNRLEEVLLTETPAQRPLPEIYAELSAPPYGLTEGVLPVLLCAFLQANRRETTLYREGTYLPEPSVADWEVLLRRPELFAAAGARLTGERAAVVARLAEKLGMEPYAVEVTRGLLKMVKGLPEFAWKTRSLPPATLALRDTLQKAKSPETLLFTDLPLALGVTFFSTDEVDFARVEAFFDALNYALQAWNSALPDAVEQAKKQMLAACGLSPDAEGWTMLRERAAKLERRVTHSTLLPFVRCAAETGTDATVLEKTLAQVANRPPRTWTGMDVERFGGQAEALGGLFQEAVAALNSPILAPEPTPAAVAAPPVPAFRAAADAAPPAAIGTPAPTPVQVQQIFDDALNQAYPQGISPKTLRLVLKNMLKEIE